MKAEEFKSALNRLSARLIEELPAINERMAMDMSAMVKDRIINDGKKADGAPLGEYSDNPLPNFFFKDKALNQSGERFYEKKRKDAEGISYAEWRRANNRPADKITLNFSGTTMGDIGVVKSVTEGTKVVTRVGPKNTKVRENGDTTEKITDDYLGKRFGNFLEPNEKELKIAQAYLEKQVKAIIDESLR